MSKVRCAIYTRKSSDEGLDQAFNSLDAQREACEAYVRSQQHEGWRALRGEYSDGGISGGTLERPALRRLLEDIDAGRVDMVVVYKIDRLTRSLSDFAKLVDRLDAAGASFVSVTQQFNTSTSMGRLTLNVLLSFAQFEREVTAERIRDKIAASKKKGMWMGGPLPLGYDKGDEGLVVNQAEADIIVSLFENYLRLGCVRELKAFADRQNYRTKQHTFKSGRIHGGVSFSRGRLYHLLSNPIYLGKVRHKQEAYDGLHKAILSEELWSEVQAKLNSNRVARASGENAAHASRLAGKVYDEEGVQLTPSHTSKKGKRYRYYVSKHFVTESGERRHGWRLPAAELEAAVLNAISSDRRAQLHFEEIGQPKFTSRDLFSQIEKVEIGPASLRISIRLQSGAALESLLVEAPFTRRRRGVEQKLVLSSDTKRNPDLFFIRRILKAMDRVEKLKSGQSLRDIADEQNTTSEYLSKNLDLAFLSPRVLKAITSGQQDPTIAVSHFHSKRLPMDWLDQERLFLPKRIS
ncbi:recombinase family protein [Hyphomonas sp. FCG-A18]|uniref:recombinase family protein n=1 Tax=Hyphomonas sp. FCG-A18 TaxID=3080019 RepID=UPI002B30F50B|nr:recombinase family protein [Hyphomonas sp. FCG-A18]